MNKCGVFSNDGSPNPESQILSPGSGWLTLGLAAALPLAVHVALWCFGIPLGCPGRFVYLYSPVVSWRLSAVPQVLVLAAGLGLGVWWTAAADTHWRRLGAVAVVAGSLGLGIWAFCAPPDYRHQYAFNAFSPSQDGAFLVEALQIEDASAYLRDFDERAATPPAAMRGTRVISNPPGTTLLAVAARELWGRFPAIRTAVPLPTDSDDAPAAAAALQNAVGVGMLFFMLLTAAWLLAAGVLYLAGRVVLDPTGAAAYAICCAFTPATLLFVPGKDPAQLLTMAVPLGLWLWAWRDGRPLPAALAGLACVGAALVSLVHLWIALITVGATLWADAPDVARLSRTVWRVFVPALAGALVGVGALAGLGIDLLAIARAVAGAQAEVTRGPHAMPLLWQALGLPLFLLLAGPALWTFTLHRLRGRRATARPEPWRGARFAAAAALGAAAVLAATIGFTNVETPRLWIPFVPLLLLGGFVRHAPAASTATDSALRAPEHRRRRALFLAVLVVVQVACAALHWALLDPRETETRLLEQRFFG